MVNDQAAHGLVGCGDDLAGAGIPELCDHPAVTHLLPVGTDIFQTGIIFLEILGHDRDRHRQLLVERDGFGIERALGCDGHAVFQHLFAVHIHGEPVVDPYFGGHTGTLVLIVGHGGVLILRRRASRAEKTCYHQ